MKVHIHPNYICYEQFIKRIPEEGYTTEEVFCDVRNTVAKIGIDGQMYVIKKYKVPTYFNRIVYTWFRKSKARRSFEYADRLLALNIETAPPVAYIEIKKGLFFHTGYFVSAFLNYPVLPRAKEIETEEERRILERQFIEFTAHLHNIKVIHKDYNPNNIFYHKENGKYHFALIDINRMDFGKDNLKLWMQAVNQLHLNAVESVDFVEQYAAIRQLDTLECLIALFNNKKARRRRDRMKALLKQVFAIKSNR